MWITFLSDKEKSEIVSNFVVASPSWVPTTSAECMPEFLPPNKHPSFIDTTLLS